MILNVTLIRWPEYRHLDDSDVEKSNILAASWGGCLDRWKVKPLRRNAQSYIRGDRYGRVKWKSENDEIDVSSLPYVLPDRVIEFLYDMKEIIMYVNPVNDTKNQRVGKDFLEDIQLLLRVKIQ